MDLVPGQAGGQAGGHPRILPVLGIALGTGALILLLTGGRSDLLAHDAMMSEHTFPGPGAFLLFVAAWQVMTATMMLPSSLPLMRLFAGANRGQEHRRLVLGTFLGAYFAVWSGFAVAALTLDAGLHALIDHSRWLDANPRFIAGAVLIVAGGFQFSPLKERCLTACRSPMGFLWRYYGRGVGRAWNLGLRHGLFCLGCCWALMLVMFAVGVGNLVWMVGLTGIMFVEKTFRSGRRLVPAVGAAFLLWGVLVILRPEWLPVAMRG